MELGELAYYTVLPRSILNDVYEPSEDTFILLDALEKDQLIKDLRPIICLEIGSGSGVVMTSLGKVLGPLYYICTDLNPIAAFATKQTSQSNNVSLDVVVTDLMDVFECRLQNSVDILIFNPLYAVTPDEEVGGTNWQKAASGGKQGREVMNRIFPLVLKILSSNGLFYLTCIIQNDIEDISQYFHAYNLEMTVVLERRCGIKHLFILRFPFKKSA